MTPTVRPTRKSASPPHEEPAPTPQSLTNAVEGDVAEALQKLKAHVEENSEYVGTRFASEARAIHDGDQPERAIYGEANAEEVKSLAEDGIPALPLPFIPRQKTN